MNTQGVYTTSSSLRGPSNDVSLTGGRVKQHLNLTLICSQNDHEPNPRLNSYSPGTLSMEWASPDACPRSGGGGGGGDSGSGGETGTGSGGGWGFWGFIKFLFWCGLLGLLLYFAIGKL